MKRNALLAIAAMVMVALGTGALYVSYKKYKKYRADQLREFKLIGTIGEAREGLDIEDYKKRLLADGVLDQVIEKYDLVNVWEMDDVAGAKSRIIGKFAIVLDGQKVKVSYQDKNKQVAHDILRFIIEEHFKKMKEAKERQRDTSQTRDFPGDQGMLSWDVTDENRLSSGLGSGQSSG